MTKTFHHRKLPDFSTLLSGPYPPDEIGFVSDKLQIWYNNTAEGWADTAPHAHQDSDECFVVLKGRLIVEVDGERHTINAGDFCCFPSGMYHAILKVEPPVESLMIRAPSKKDKLYQSSDRLDRNNEY